MNPVSIQTENHRRRGDELRAVEHVNISALAIQD
jgi:hypothetical protein